MERQAHTCRAWARLVRAVAAVTAVAVLGAVCVRRAAAEEFAGKAEPAAGAATQTSAVERRLEQVSLRVQEAAEGSRELLLRQPDLYALLLLQVEKARLACRSYWPGVYRDRRIEADLARAEALLDALLRGEEPSLQTHGRLERAYLAPNDGSAQPYVVYVPDSYDGAEEYGLLVYLHGYSADLNKRNWVRYMYADVLEQYAAQAGYIMLMPFARSNTDFQGAGEDDVVLAIGEVMEDYRIAPDRVVLSGYSMGGMGVWTIGGHYPERFAALLAMSGRSDFYLWKGIRPEDLPGFKRKLAEQEFGVHLLPNYERLPLFLIHGSSDWGMPVRQSRRMYRLLRERGLDARYVELEGADHFFFYRQQECLPELLEWLKERRRTGPPRRVAFRTHTLKYNRAYWAEILAIQDWGRAAQIECEIGQDGRTLAVTSDNVLYLRLQPPAELVGDPGALDVSWNGRPVPARPDAEGRLSLGDWGTGDAAMLKTPGLCGPVREAFAGPFVMVHGGEGTRSARHAARAAEQWTRFAKGTARVLSVEEVDEQTIRECNLLLFGQPEENALMRRVMPDLPVRVEGGAIIVEDRRYDADQFGLCMIYPNPLAPERCVVINCGPPWGRELPVNHVYDMLPDFIVYADEKSEDGTECNKYVCAGFFDQYWRLSAESTWYSDEPR